MADIQLNDGIYHPIYNQFGWRCRYVNGDNHLWHEDLGEQYEITNFEKCFDGSMIYSGNDEVVRDVSGREDGLKMAGVAGISGAVPATEWN